MNDLTSAMEAATPPHNIFNGTERGASFLGIVLTLAVDIF